MKRTRNTLRAIIPAVALVAAAVCGVGFAVGVAVDEKSADSRTPVADAVDEAAEMPAATKAAAAKEAVKSAATATKSVVKSAANGTKSAAVAVKDSVKSATGTKTEKEATATERIWTDSTGKFTVRATLVDFDADTVVLRKATGGQVSLAMERLSTRDQAFLKTPAAELVRGTLHPGADHPENPFTDQPDTARAGAAPDAGKPDVEKADVQKADTEKTDAPAAGDAAAVRTWKLTDGTEIRGTLLGYDAANMNIVRSRGVVLVDDRAFTDYPKAYQAVIRGAIGREDGGRLRDTAALNRWAAKYPDGRTLHVVGLTVMFAEGGKYPVPFDLLTAESAEADRAGFTQWYRDEEMPRQKEAAERQRQEDEKRSADEVARQDRLDEQRFQAEQNRLDRLSQDRRQNNAFSSLSQMSGILYQWRVVMVPRPGGFGPSRWVTAVASTADNAKFQAEMQNPQYVATTAQMIGRVGGGGSWYPRPRPYPYPGPMPGPFPSPDPDDPDLGGSAGAFLSAPGGGDAGGDAGGAE